VDEEEEGERLRKMRRGRRDIKKKKIYKVIYNSFLRKYL